MSKSTKTENAAAAKRPTPDRFGWRANDLKEVPRSGNGKPKGKGKRKGRGVAK